LALFLESRMALRSDLRHHCPRVSASPGGNEDGALILFNPTAGYFRGFELRVARRGDAALKLLSRLRTRTRTHRIRVSGRCSGWSSASWTHARAAAAPRRAWLRDIACNGSSTPRGAHMRPVIGSRLARLSGKEAVPSTSQHDSAARRVPSKWRTG